MFQPHQLGFYDAFHAWNDSRFTWKGPDGKPCARPEYLAKMAELGAQFDNMWGNRWSRRVGKTSSSLLMGEEQSIRVANHLGHGAQGMAAIPVQKKIGGVIVPLVRHLFRNAPFGYAPEYRVSGAGLHEHLYIPAIESRIVLVGIDSHPRALAGTYLDFFIGTEFGFTEPGMADEYTSVIQPQFQQRPWAFSLIETSEPEIPDHDFNTRFATDCRLRRAWWSMVITDNTSLPPGEIEAEIRRSGGRDNPICKRELFNEVEADPETKVIPEFDEAVHVVDPQFHPQPDYALAHVGMDPGVTDPFGIAGGYLHFDDQQFKVQFAWMAPNASTDDVVEVLQGRERKLWGTEHVKPLERTARTPLQTIAHAEPTAMGNVWEAPPKALTYWDPGKWTLRPNPFARISDIQNRFILDLNKDHAMGVRPAEKEPGSAEADLLHLRSLFKARHPDGRPKIVILKNGQTDRLIEQLRSGRWKLRDDVHKVDWGRSKALGHLDCLSALKYLVRDLRWTRDPAPPVIMDPHAPNVFIPEHLKPKEQKPIALNRDQRFGTGLKLPKSGFRTK